MVREFAERKMVVERLALTQTVIVTGRVPVMEEGGSLIVKGIGQDEELVSVLV
jgi:hypothetical protein